MSIQPIEYENFDLRIGTKIEKNKYPVEVLYSPLGEVKSVTQSFPLDDTEFTDLIDYLKELVGRANDAVDLGEKMRQLLFPDPIWSKFIENRSVLTAQKSQKGLRVRLRIDPPELSQLPWEYCHDKIFDFLAQDIITPFARYPAEPLAPGTLESPEAIRILLVTANPSDLKQLKLDNEVKIVEKALTPLIDSGHAYLDIINKAQVHQMRKALRDGNYHVLHFLGHGVIKNKKGAIALEKEDGTTQAVLASQLRAMLRSTSVKIVYLNACNTATHDGVHPINSVARSLIRAGIPAVLAMQFKVPDKTALKFSEELYQSLAQSKPLDLAVTEVRQAAYIDEGDMVYWGIPVLFMRASDGVIWSQKGDKRYVNQSTRPDHMQAYLKNVVRKNESIVLPTPETTGRKYLTASLSEIFEHPSLAEWQFPKEKGKDGVIETIRHKSAIAHIYYHKHLILLGDTNIGKRTLLRYLALCFSNALLSNDKDWLKLLEWEYTVLGKATKARKKLWEEEPPVPIFINLPSFIEVGKATHSSQIPDLFWGELIKELDDPALGSILREKAQKGETILLFHGIDEIPKVDRENLWLLISELANSSVGNSRFVVTCNTSTFEIETEPPFKPDVKKLGNLDRDQIMSLADKVYRAFKPFDDFQFDPNSLEFQETINRKHSIIKALDDYLRFERPINSLLGVPGFLSLFIIRLIDSKEAPFQSFIYFYQDVVKHLLKQWRPFQSKSYEKKDWEKTLLELRISSDELENLLWLIARESYDGKDFEDSVFPEDKLRSLVFSHFGNEVDTRRFLEYTSSCPHVLVTRKGERGRGYIFRHHLLESYLAACHIAHSPLLHREIIEISHQTKWKELQQILQLSAKRLMSIDNDIHKVIDTAKIILPLAEPDLDDETGWLRIWFASEIIASVEKERINLDLFGKELLPHLKCLLVKLLTNGSLSHFQRAGAGDALGILGDPRPGVCTKKPEMIGVSNFYISKYPITNAQFRFFVNDYGYFTDTDKFELWWSKKGSLYIRTENITEPLYWQDPIIAIDNKPVVGISWFEAEAYTNWLSELTGEKFDLPTIEQFHPLSLLINISMIDFLLL